MASYKKKYRRVSVQNRFKTLIFKLVFLFLICVTFIGFFYIPKFRLKNIVLKNDSSLKSQIEGTVKSELSKKKLFALPQDNFFLFNEKSLSNEIKASFPKIKNIYFDREFPDTLVIKFDEKKEAALWCGAKESGKEEKCYLLDEDGAVIQENINISDYNFNDFNPILKFKDLRIDYENPTPEFKSLIPEFIKFLGNVKNNFQIKTKEILVYNAKYEIYFNEGWFTVLDSETNFELAFDNLKLILEQKMKTKEERKNLEYIDLRLENKVFLKRR